MTDGRARVQALLEDPRRRDRPYAPVVLGDDVIHEPRRGLAAQQLRLGLLPPMSGQSVLDLGSNTGYVAIQLRKRGATRCLGVDEDILWVTLASLLVELEGLSGIEFVRGDLFDLEIPRPFDNVLLLSILDYEETFNTLETLKRYGRRIFVEPTNHGWHYKTKSQIEDYVAELQRFGEAELLGYTDYQDRGLIQINT